MKAFVPHFYDATYAGPATMAPVLSVGCRRYSPRPANVYDRCLAEDVMLWTEIVQAGGLTQLCCPQGRPGYAQRPWVTQPELGRRFAPIGSETVAALTADSTTENTILTFEVPKGYDGVINYFKNGIGSVSPTGFIEGSGDITWRLSADGRYLRDMGDIVFSQGSLTTPAPTPNGGLRVYSGNTVKFTAVLSTGNPLNPAAIIVCQIAGWLYPR